MEFYSGLYFKSRAQQTDYFTPGPSPWRRWALGHAEGGAFNDLPRSGRLFWGLSGHTGSSRPVFLIFTTGGKRGRYPHFQAGINISYRVLFMLTSESVISAIELICYLGSIFESSKIVDIIFICAIMRANLVIFSVARSPLLDKRKRKNWP